MQLDFERRRRVELEDITGAVVRLGRRLGVPTPIYDVLYAVLKVRAAAFGGLWDDGRRGAGPPVARRSSARSNSLAGDRLAPLAPLLAGLYVPATAFWLAALIASEVKRRVASGSIPSEPTAITGHRSL